MATLFSGGKDYKPPHKPDENKARAQAEMEMRRKQTRAAGFRSTILSQWYGGSTGGTKSSFGA